MLNEASKSTVPATPPEEISTTAIEGSLTYSREMAKSRHSYLIKRRLEDTSEIDRLDVVLAIFAPRPATPNAAPTPAPTPVVPAAASAAPKRSHKKRTRR